MKFNVLILYFFVSILLGCSKQEPSFLYGYGPSEIFAGKDFNLQQDGASAIWVNVEGAKETTQVVINENILKSNINPQSDAIYCKGCFRQT